MLEIPNLKRVYEDETGELWLFKINEDYTLHAFVQDCTKLSLMKHYRTIMIELCDQLKAKGIPALKTWVQTDEQYKYAMFFGFEPTGNEIQILGYTGMPFYELEIRLDN
jgi:hypothetical protein